MKRAINNRAIVLCVLCLLALGSTSSLHAQLSGSIHIPGTAKGTCWIKFEVITGGSEAARRADLNKVMETFRKAFNRSADMRFKVRHACDEHDGEINVSIFRDVSAVSYGGANTAAGRISLDIGDIEKVDQKLSGDPDAVQRVAEGMLARVLAHEIDHLRGAGHEDPKGLDVLTETGPAVDDANRVLEQAAGIPASHRQQYLTLDPETGRFETRLDVETEDGLKEVKWDATPFNRIENNSSSHRIAPNALDGIKELRTRHGDDPRTAAAIVEAIRSAGYVTCSKCRETADALKKYEAAWVYLTADGIEADNEAAQVERNTTQRQIRLLIQSLADCARKFCSTPKPEQAQSGPK